MAEENIDIRTEDGLADSFVCWPDRPGTFPAVLFYMDVMGVRDDLRDMARRLASHGYVVLLPNLFYRVGRQPLFDWTRFYEDETRAYSRTLLAGLTPDMARRDAAVFIDHISRHRMAAPGKIGITGYCLGGTAAMRAAGNYPGRIAAAASFHGSNLATDAPDSPHVLAQKSGVHLYVGCAVEDPGMPPAMIDRLQAAFDAAGTQYRLEVYPDARHGWTIPHTKPYQHEGAERHWDRLLELFSETFATA